MEKFLDRKEGIGGDYLWEELGDAIHGLILRILVDLGARLGRGEREMEGGGLGRGEEEEELPGVGLGPKG